MDFPNYPKEQPRFDNSRKGHFECECRLIVQKSFASNQNGAVFSGIQTLRTQPLKLINDRTQAKLPHDQYRDIHNPMYDSHFETIYNIRTQACQLQTVCTLKKCLSKFETKRHYVDACTALGYGYPIFLKQTNEKTLDVLPLKRYPVVL